MILPQSSDIEDVVYSLASYILMFLELLSLISVAMCNSNKINVSNNTCLIVYNYIICHGQE